MYRRIFSSPGGRVSDAKSPRFLPSRARLPRLPAFRPLIARCPVMTLGVSLLSLSSGFTLGRNEPPYLDPLLGTGLSTRSSEKTPAYVTGSYDFQAFSRNHPENFSRGASSSALTSVLKIAAVRVLSCAAARGPPCFAWLRGSNDSSASSSPCWSGQPDPAGRRDSRRLSGSVL